MSKTSIKGRKFSIQVSSLIPSDADEIFDELSKTHSLHYVGIYSIQEKLYLYIHTAHTVSGNNLMKIINSLGMECENLQKNAMFSGKMISEKGNKRVHGGNRAHKKRPYTDGNTFLNTINNNNTVNNNINNNINLIVVNPIGQESIDHITPEFIQQILSENHGPDVVFRFGTKMYSLQENMNFKTDVKSGYIKGRCGPDGIWETRRKNEGFGLLMDNLKDKNEQAVLKYLSNIPEDDFEQFKADMHWIMQHKVSIMSEDVPVYESFVKRGFNLLSANIADKKRRMERDCGKKLRLV